MDGAIIQGVCKKQTGVSLSTMEAEFTSASHVVREILDLKKLVRGVGFKVAEPMCMMMDNQAAIRQLESEDSMASSKKWMYGLNLLIITLSRELSSRNTWNLV